MNYTPIHNRFWSDGWIRGLNALDRYLFFYLLTNGRSQCTGIYELPLDMMATESGIDEKDLRLAMLQRLEPKVYYKEGWVIIMNFIKHRVSDSPALIKGIQNEFENLPAHIKEIALQKGYPLHTLPRPSRSRVEQSRVDTSGTEVPPVRIEKDINPDLEVNSPRKTAKYPNSKQVFSLWGKVPGNWSINTTERKAAENLFKERGLKEIGLALKFWREHKDGEFCPDCSTPFKLDSNWSKLFRFKSKNGL